ncbi:regulatory protein, FmdB family [Candidatus Vecturithrix granuli]|uniref:Regulatory protein, FmdB family n=1 Tax=Vecturithrix granuli TaxID=1499967 RepID=A0A081BZI9_VECG1|nr:regulatory protein, FmdB family [Candidatus Vecturithrix granuli]
MPTYEYECIMQGHRFEQFQGSNDAPVATCPECGGPVRRLLGTGTGFIMKGSDASPSASSIQCGREQTCCGRTERCDRPPCNH